MKRFDLQRSYGEEFQLTLKPGMGWIMYMDEGPTGPCGQSMSITCPHCVFAIFPNEDTMIEAAKTKFRNGQKFKIMYGVIDNYSTGNGSIYSEIQDEN